VSRKKIQRYRVSICAFFEVTWGNVVYGREVNIIKGIHSFRYQLIIAFIYTSSLLLVVQFCILNMVDWRLRVF